MDKWKEKFIFLPPDDVNDKDIAGVIGLTAAGSFNAR
jgi:hypothetical protein